MSWTLREKTASAEDIYDLVKKHRLVPTSSMATVQMCQTVEASSLYYELFDEDEDKAAAIMLVHGSTDEIAEIDFVPKAGYFVPGSTYHHELRELVTPVLKKLFNGNGVRRISASVPGTRKRTMRILKALGFHHEGCRREGVSFYGQTAPQDLILYGLLAKDGV